MKLLIEPKIVSGAAVLIASAIVLLAIKEMIEISQVTGPAIEAGWAIHYDLTYLQRELRVAMALLFCAVALWSRRGTKYFIIISASLYLVYMFWRMFLASPYYPNAPQPEFLVLVGVAIMSVSVMLFRNLNNTVIAMVAPIYVLAEYLIWYISTYNLKKSSGVAELQPPTAINNIFNGAHWWHIFILIFSILLLAWGFRAILIENRPDSSTQTETI